MAAHNINTNTETNKQTNYRQTIDTDVSSDCVLFQIVFDTATLVVIKLSQ